MRQLGKLLAPAKNGSIVGSPAANRPNASDSSGLDDDRERILTAAGHLFDELGVADASLERIASQAGLPRSAVLRQFASKLDLITLYVDRWAAERRAAAEAERAKYDGDPRGVLLACAAIIDDPNGTTTGRSWVHFAAELPDGHPVPAREPLAERVHLPGEPGRTRAYGPMMQPVPSSLCSSTASGPAPR